MKCYFSLLIIPLLFFLKAFSQQAVTTHPPLLGVQFNLNDYKQDRPFGSAKNMNPGLGVQFVKGIRQHWDWSFSLAGSFADSTTKLGVSLDEKHLLLEGDLMLRGRMFPQASVFQPYITAGLGLSAYGNYIGPFIPAGLGIQVRIFDEAYILISSQYRLSLVSAFNSRYFYSAGLSGAIGKGREKKIAITKVVIPAQAVQDRDRDGIVDTADVCPDLPGLARFRGCPDRDNDGIPDSDDRCPDRFGILRYQGCPIPDQDRDGINDEEDKCPAVPGILRLQGCPVPDLDKDGVSDEEDKCPDLAGLRENQGCPAITEEINKQVELAAKNIFFKTGRYELLPKSFSALDEVAAILKDNIRLKLDIEGHTDNVGKPGANQLLSEKRAGAVAAYLAGKGIEAHRLKTAGYGQDKPVATNSTAEGRAANRRVVLKLYYE